MIHRFVLRLIVLLPLAFGGLSMAWAQEDTGDEETVVRITKLEATLRQMAGQIEELQFANRKLEDQIKALQTGGSSAAPSSPAVAAPKMSTAEPAGGPLDLMAASKGGAASPAGTLASQAAMAKAKPETKTELVQAAAPKDAKSDFAAAKSLYKSGDYPGSANALRQFTQAWPKDPSITEATLLLGDAEYKQKRYAEAAQQYLKIAQATPVTSSTALAFAKLGDALVSMGQKPQACATFAEFGKRFSDAESALKARVEKAKAGAGC
jgi:TolA-binding protein